MKRLGWTLLYALLFYVGLVIGINTAIEKAERRDEPECSTGCCW